MVGLPPGDSPSTLRRPHPLADGRADRGAPRRAQGRLLRRAVLLGTLVLFLAGLAEPAQAAAGNAAPSPPWAGGGRTVALTSDLPFRAAQSRDLGTLPDSAPVRLGVFIAGGAGAPAPTSGASDIIASYLRASGFASVRQSANGRLVLADGSNANLDAAFGVREHAVRLAGRDFRTILTAPRLPASVAALVQGLVGLDNFSVAQPTETAQPVRVRPDAAVGNQCCSLSPQELDKLYDDSGAETGAGQTIVVAGVYAASTADLDAYNQQFGLPAFTYSGAAPSFRQVCVGTGSPAGCAFNPVQSGEVTLDVEMAHALAPQAAIVNYMAASASETDLAAAFNQVVTDNPGHVVSTSWAGCEADSSVGFQQSLDSIVQNGVAKGETWFAASGDTGPYGCGWGGAVSVQWPASSPHVVGVGGTNVTCAPAMNGAHTTCDAYGSESAWNQSGGGQSALFPKPPFQTGCGVPNDGKRDVPDIASVGGPSPGVWEFFNGAWSLAFGTSAAAPQMAARFAELNQKLGGSGLGLVSTRLYELCGSAVFHDISSGSSALDPAKVGYDEVTGLGTIDANELLSLWSEVPAAPGSFAAQGGPRIVNLSWASPAPGNRPETYRIYRGLAAGAEAAAPIAIVNGTGYNDTSVSPGTTYYYQVSAVNAAGEGPKASELSATTLTPPGAPTAVVATSSAGRTTLSWTPPSFTGTASITGYDVFRGSQSGSEALLAAGGAETTYTDFAVVPGHAYFYRVAARNVAGPGAESAEASVTTPSPPGTPPQPTGSATPGSITISWTTPSSGGSPILGYLVYRSTTAGAPSLLASLGNMTSFRDTTVAPGATYAYDVAALNAVGNSPNSTAVSLSALDVPAPPRSLGATPWNGTILLAWKPPASDGGAPIGGYAIYRAVADHAATLLARVPPTTGFLDRDVAPGTSYRYSIAAWNAVGPGDNGSTANATSNAAPATPSGLTASGTSSGILLGWTEPTSSAAPVGGFEIARGTTTDSIAPYASVTNVTRFEDRNLTAGQSYLYRIRAFGPAGESNETAAVAAEVPAVPEAPTHLSASAVGSAIRLNWTLPAGSPAAQGYDVLRAVGPGTPAAYASAGPSSAFVDGAVTPGTRYEYEVQPRNAGGTGPGAFVNETAPAPVAKQGSPIPSSGPAELTLAVFVATGLAAWRMGRLGRR